MKIYKKLFRGFGPLSFSRPPLLLLFVFTTCSFASAQTLPIIADHTYSDLSDIPDSWIEYVKKNIKIYYGHTSHGTQIPVGLERIETKLGSKYNVAIGWSLPNEEGALCIRDRSDTYDPDDFFPTVPDALAENPEINVVIYGWCGQTGDDNWQDLLDSYINDIKTLQRQYPNVTFVYMTGNAQETDCSGCNRYLFNSALRDSVKKNNQVLFDFADLDCWYNDETNSYISPSWCTCADSSVPLQHPHYDGDEAGHTTYESCENKGRAFWWMLARIAGWSDVVPVELISFEAFAINNAVLLKWQTASESNNFGFDVQRSNDGENFKKIGFIQGHNTTSNSQEYCFQDKTIKTGEKYFYCLKQIDFNGNISYSPIIKISIDQLHQFSLYQNYPNPFNPTTEIAYNLPEATHVQLVILNLEGKEVATIVDKEQTPGLKRVVWNSRNKNGNTLASGIYFVQLRCKGLCLTQKMVLTK